MKKKEQLKEELEENKKAEQEKLKAQEEIIKEELELLKNATKIKIEMEKERFKQLKEGMDLEKTAIQEHYSTLMEQENLLQEARVMAVKGNNDEIISLLNTYNPKWQDAGQSFSDAMINGLNSENENMRDAIDRSLDLEPTITRQKEELATLEGSLESLKEQDGDYFPEFTEGLEGAGFASKELVGEMEEVGHGVQDLSGKLEESKGFWASLGDGIVGVAKVIRDDFRRELDEQKEHYSKLWEEMPSITETGTYQTMAKLGEGLLDGSERLNAWTANLEETINEGFDNMAFSAFESGKNIVNGLIDGLSSMWNDLVDTAKSMAEGVSNIFNKIWEINSPSKLFRRKTLAIGEGAIEGMEISKPLMESKAIELARSVDVDYTQTSTPQVQAPVNSGFDSGTIDKLINAIEGMQNQGANDAGQPQPIILKIGENELARTTISSIREYQKQTGHVILG